MKLFHLLIASALVAGAAGLAVFFRVRIEKMLPAKMAGKYQAYVKGLQKLKIDIPPSKLPEFFAYMDYRFAQGRDDQKYLFDIFSNDYIEMLAEGYKPEDIVSDFEQFAVDQAEIMNRKDLMEGIDADNI